MPRGAVVLVTLDGVRWQEIFRGVDPTLAREHELPSSELRSAAALTPNLHRLMRDRGAALGDAAAGRAHADMRASGPSFVSLPGYIELLTGARQSGCTDNLCGRAPLPTVLDEHAGLTHELPVVFSSWPRIGAAASMLPSNVVSSVGQRDGHERERLAAIPEVAAALEAGEREPPWPLGDPGFRRDAHTAQAALAYLRRAHPRFSFISLGDTDELGHADDYRGYLDALHQADAFIGAVAEVVRAEIARGRPTTLLVTTDHGRADTFAEHGPEHPESARVWLVAAGSRVTARGVVGLTRTRHLADVAPTLRLLLGLPASRASNAGSALTELLGARELASVLHPLFTLAQSSASR
ncbi:MAG: hypothetical protein ACHQ53_10920 [Polyangiales bacterium]